MSTTPTPRRRYTNAHLLAAAAAGAAIGSTAGALAVAARLAPTIERAADAHADAARVLDLITAELQARTPPQSQPR